jgi:hypothetical protein
MDIRMMVLSLRDLGHSLKPSNTAHVCRERILTGELVALSPPSGDVV